MSNKLITINEEEYDDLLKSKRILQELKFFGLYDWDGYKEYLRFEKAMNDYQDNYEEDN